MFVTGRVKMQGLKMTDQSAGREKQALKLQDRRRCNLNPTNLGPF